ncbi:MAG TPA: glycosyltransferase [Chthoniobacterales bacterium]
MKVAFVFITMPVGGAEDFAIQVSNEFPADVEVHFVCLRNLGVLGTELLAKGQHVSLVEVAKSKRLSLRGIWDLSRWFKKTGITVVHSQTYNAHTYAIPAARIARAVCVLHQQKTLARMKFHRSVVLWFLVRWATRIVALSERTRRDLARAFVLPESKIDVVPNAVDRSQFFPCPDPALKAALRGELGLNPEGFLIGGVASLHSVKNHEATLEMAATLHKKGLAFRVILIGEGGQHDILKQRIAQLNLTGVVTLLGVKRPVGPWMQALDLVVMPSLWEGQPLALLQAMACNLPIVASRIEGNIAALGTEHPGLFDLEARANYEELVQRAITQSAFRDELIHYQAKTVVPDTKTVAARLLRIYRAAGGEGR